MIPALCEEVILHVDDDQRGGALLRPSAVAKTNIVIQDMHHHIIDVQCLEAASDLVAAVVERFSATYLKPWRVIIFYEVADNLPRDGMPSLPQYESHGID